MHLPLRCSAVRRPILVVELVHRQLHLIQSQCSASSQEQSSDQVHLAGIVRDSWMTDSAPLLEDIALGQCSLVDHRWSHAFKCGFS